ncbi:TRH protein, partial [Tichodroma muraria]|nr:TRH protein [Tichodroma muraria]
LEKRQHPGKRDVEEENSYGDIQKRQHPGKRETEDDLDVYLHLKRQQPPSRKSLLDQYPMYKHQRPSKRGWNYEVDLYSEKCQHSGKRHRNSDSSDDTGPCNFQESFTCHKASLLPDLVEDISRDRVEEKHQHPGKRSAWESETEE